MKWLIIIFVVILIAGGLTVYFYPQVLRISEIDCYTQYGQCELMYVDQAKFLLGRPIYWPLPKKEISSQFSAFPAIAQVSIYRRLPKTVVVGLSLRQPIAAVLGASTQIGVIDDKGVIFQTTDRSSLPVLTIEGDVSVGTNLSLVQLNAAKLLSQIAGIVQLQVKGVLSGSQLTTTVQNGTQIILDAVGTADDWVSSLQSIWARSKIDGKFMQKIDLRFNSPTVSY